MQCFCIETKDEHMDIIDIIGWIFVFLFLYFSLNYLIDMLKSLSKYTIWQKNIEGKLVELRRRFSKAELLVDNEVLITNKIKTVADQNFVLNASINNKLLVLMHKKNKRLTEVVVLYDYDIIDVKLMHNKEINKYL